MQEQLKQIISELLIRNGTLKNYDYNRKKRNTGGYKLCKDFLR